MSVTVIIMFHHFLKARVSNGESTSGTEDSSMEVSFQPQSISSNSSKKVGRNRKNERKKKTEDEKILSPSHIPGNNSQGRDQGYMSGGSQCTPGLVAVGTTGNPPIGHTPLSGYHSSSCDTEYSSLPEDHVGVPPLLKMVDGFTEQLIDNQGNLVIKTEQFSPPSQGRDVQYGQPSPYKPSRVHVHSRKYQPPRLHTLPEIIGPTQDMSRITSQSNAFAPFGKNVHLHDTFSSGYSSFDGSPNIANDEGFLMNGTSGHHHSIRSSDLSSSSRSSFSTLSSRLSSPSSSYRKDSFESNRTIKPPDLVLKPLNFQGIQMSDFKHIPPMSYYSRQQSDEVSIQSSHSSRYSGSVSEYSDDFRYHPDIQFSPRQTLPPISSQPGFVQMNNTNHSQSIPMAFEPASQYSSLQSPASYTDSLSGGSIPLQHLAISSQQKAMVVDSHVRSESPNLIMGNMSTFSNQLHQENLLFESLASTSSLGLVQLPH